MRANEKRMKVIAATLDANETYIKLKPVYDAYSKKGFKRAKEKYAAEHKDELAAMKKAYGYLMHHGGTVDIPVQALQAEYAALREQNRDKETRLAAIQGDLRKLREIRTWVDRSSPAFCRTLPNRSRSVLLYLPNCKKPRRSRASIQRSKRHKTWNTNAQEAGIAPASSVCQRTSCFQTAVKLREFYAAPSDCGPSATFPGQEFFCG